MKKGSFKMKKFSGFGNSPMKNDGAKTLAKAGTKTLKKERKAMGYKAKGTNLKTGETTYKTGYSFDDAFADARKSSKETFVWKDKKYHTKTKEEI